MDAGNVDGWYELGLLLGQIGDFRGAEAAFRKAIQIHPDFATAHFNLGLTLVANPQSKLDWPGAIAEFREAIRYQPDYAEAHNLLGAGLSSQGDYAEAIVELRRAIELKPSLAEAHFNLGIALEKKGEFEDAAKEYRAAVELKSDYPEATTALGKLLFHMGKSQESERELEAALLLDPDLADANHALAGLLQSLGKAREARIELSVAEDLSARKADAMQSVELSNSGLALASQGDFAKARETLRKAILLKPDYGVPHYNLGLILADQKDFAGAFQELVKAISLMPGNAKPWLQTCRVLRAEEKVDSALAACRWAERLAPGDPAIRAETESLRSVSPAGTAGADSDLPVVEPQLGAQSDTEDAHRAFAMELMKQNDALGAIGELNRALTLNPASLEARRDLASAYEAFGDHNRAILEDYKILRAVPEDAATRLALGQSLIERGDTNDAIEEFRIALKYNPAAKPIRKALERALASRPQP